MSTNKASAPHTPVPWTVEPGLRQRILAPNGEPVALPCSGTTVSAPDNARFIVRACNAHEELLEALKGLVESINLRPLNIRRDFSMFNYHNAALKAIEKAEKGVL